MAKGLSRSQARGHPKAKEKSVRKQKPIETDAFQVGLRALREGKSLSEAAATIRVSPDRLRNQARALGIIRLHRRRWVVRKNLPRKMLIYSRGEAYPIVLDTQREASKAGRYMAAVRKFLRTNDPSALKPFIGKTITDDSGTKHPFETSPNALYRLTSSGGDSFEQVYSIIA
jgi:hypothetical protein